MNTKASTNIISKKDIPDLARRKMMGYTVFTTVDDDGLRALQLKTYSAQRL